MAFVRHYQKTNNQFSATIFQDEESYIYNAARETESIICSPKRIKLFGRLSCASAGKRKTGLFEAACQAITASISMVMVKRTK